MTRYVAGIVDVKMGSGDEMVKIKIKVKPCTNNECFLRRALFGAVFNGF